MSSDFTTRPNGFLTFLIWIGVLLSTPRHSFSNELENPPKAFPHLNQKKIHNIYSEGDFDGVVAAIDSFTNSNRTYSQSDSVFIAKHLAVIYTANPATREKGKHYMFRLLNLLPSAKIVDMFVSDEIDHVFEKVKEEYEVKMRSLGNDEPTKLESNQYASDKMMVKGNSETTSQPMPKAKTQIGKTTSPAIYWVAGGVTFAAITGTTFYLLHSKKSTDKTYDLPQ